MNEEIVLRAVLQEVCDHYRKYYNYTCRILNDYYLMGTDKVMRVIPFEINAEIDILLHGFSKVVEIPYNGKIWQLMLHENMLHENQPLILLKDANSTFVVTKRTDERTHLHLFTLRPKIIPMLCDASIAKEWMDMLSSKHYMISNDEVLENLSAIWLGRQPRQNKLNYMTINTDELKAFLELLATNADAKVTFLLSGQSILYAYLQVFDTRPIMTLQVGCVFD